MRYKVRIKRHRSTLSNIRKKLERREKMAKIKHPIREKKAKTSKELPEEQHFVMRNGDHLKSVEDLARLMDHLEDSEFGFHVNEEKNDFANWIKDVFHEEKLAEELTEAKDRKHCHIALLRHVAFGRK